MEALTIVLLTLAGLIVGSALTALLFRLRHKQSFIRGRSRCPHCSVPLSPRDLIPLLSFVFLRGRCRHCSKPISWYYPLVELATLNLFLGIYLFHGGMIGMPEWYVIARDSIFATFLLAIFVYDLHYTEIPDELSLPALGIALLFALKEGHFLPALMAAAIGAVFFYLQYALSRGRWVGGGDIRLGALMGAILGWPLIFFALGLSYVIGAFIASLLLLLTGATLKSEFPFGTVLTAATLFTVFLGPQMLHWYLVLIGVR